MSNYIDFLDKKTEALFLNKKTCLGIKQKDVYLVNAKGKGFSILDLETKATTSAFWNVSSRLRCLDLPPSPWVFFWKFLGTNSPGIF